MAVAYQRRHQGEENPEKAYSGVLKLLFLLSDGCSQDVHSLCVSNASEWLACNVF